MTDSNEIVKDLESYIELLHRIGLKNSKQEKILQSAIDLIQRQNAEIERLKEMVGDVGCVDKQ